MKKDLIITTKNKTNMKSKEEIEKLAFLKYPRVINDNPLCRNPNNPMEDDNTYGGGIWISAYTQCQKDMAKDQTVINQLKKNKLKENLTTKNK